jgi:hypothetical protein
MSQRSFRSSAVRLGRTVSSISFSRNAASYRLRPRLRSQAPISIRSPKCRPGAHDWPNPKSMSTDAVGNDGSGSIRSQRRQHHIGYESRATHCRIRAEVSSWAYSRHQINGRQPAFWQSETGGDPTPAIRERSCGCLSQNHLPMMTAAVQPVRRAVPLA